MNVKSPIMRYQLEHVLLDLSDLEYQMEVWVKMDRQQMRVYVGFDITVEILLNDFIWEEGERLVGSLLRDKEELDVCLEVVNQVETFLAYKGEGLTDEEYIRDSHWLSVIAAARSALRVMNKGVS
jgi:hypothetical protein